MKQLPLISSALYAQPWYIRPQAHAELGRLYQAYLRGELVVPGGFFYSGDDDEDPEPGEWPTLETETFLGGRLVLIRAEGIIDKNAVDMECGPKMVALSELDRALATLGTDAETIVLDINSPGGSTLGMTEVISTLDGLRAAGKRIVAYTDTEAASCGYFLASSATEIWAAPSALVGCIGTYIAALDDSRQWEMDGLKLKLFRDGAIKAVGHPGKVWTPEEESFLQGLVDSASARFKGYVRARRPGVTDEDMQGQWWSAQDAPPALLDGFAHDLDSLLLFELGRLV
jgi:ClpP class serine protease